MTHLLPTQLRLLFIAGPQRTGAWLAEAFAADSACEVELDEVRNAASGLARLRDTPYDAVLVSHEGPQRDALLVLDAIRTGSRETQPVIILGTLREHEFADFCYESGGDAYVCVDNTTTRGLLWKISIACQHHRLLSENRRLRDAHRHRLALEHGEASRVLDQQRAMLAELEGVYAAVPGSDDAPPLAAAAELPAPLVEHYRDLLRCYVMMGSGNLGDEICRLAELLAENKVSPHQAMRLHLSVLEQMVQGLGNRSTRHVMTRADMLILEIMINLAEEYRHRLLHANARRTASQRWLPGFGEQPVLRLRQTA